MSDFWGELDEVLDCLAACGNVSPTEIARRLALSEDTVVSLLAMLTRDGKVRICLVDRANRMVLVNSPSSPYRRLLGAGRIVAVDAAAIASGIALGAALAGAYAGATCLLSVEDLAAETAGSEASLAS